MPNIFISYRRDDSAAHAGRVCDRLKQVFGDEAVFVDVDDIAPGDRFPNTLRSHLGKADVVLALIGPRWLSDGGAGARRIDDAADFVHIELASALVSSSRLIPVLINGTRMPEAAQLPEPLKPLAECQAIDLSDRHFDRDMARLFETLGKDAGSRRSLARWGGAAFALVVIAVSAWWFVAARDTVTKSPTPTSAADASPNNPLAKSTASAVKIDGKWEADVYYEWDKRSVREPFQFRLVAGQLIGSAGYLGYPRGIVAGELNGNVLTFETRSQASVGERDFEYTHRYRGEVDGDSIRTVMQSLGYGQSGVPREFILDKVSGD